MVRWSGTSEFGEVTLSGKLGICKRSWPFVLAPAIPWLLCAGQQCMSRSAALGTHERSRSASRRIANGLASMFTSATEAAWNPRKASAQQSRTYGVNKGH